MIHPLPTWGRPDPVRVSVARSLGSDIDGAWWPRTDRITNELPRLVATMTPVLGHVRSINVNWQPLQRPPDLNWSDWRHKHQHVMTVRGDEASANLLMISYATHSTLALMVLRRAANLPIDALDHDKPVFLTACAIILATQQQCAAAKTNSAPPEIAEQDQPAPE